MTTIDEIVQEQEMSTVIALLEYYQKQLDLSDYETDVYVEHVRNIGMTTPSEKAREEQEKEEVTNTSNKKESVDDKQSLGTKIKSGISKLINMIINGFKKIISKIMSIGKSETKVTDMIVNNPDACKEAGDKLQQIAKSKVTQEAATLTDVIAHNRFKDLNKLSPAEKADLVRYYDKQQAAKKAAEDAAKDAAERKEAISDAVNSIKKFVPFGLLRNIGIGAVIALCATLFILLYKRKTNYQLPSVTDIGRSCVELNSQLQKSMNGNGLKNVTINPKTKDYMTRVANWNKRYTKNEPEFESKHSEFELTREQEKIFVDAVYLAASAKNDRFIGVLQDSIGLLKQFNAVIKKSNGIVVNHLVDVSKQYANFIIGINKAITVGSDLIKNMGLSLQQIRGYQNQKERDYKPSKAII